MSILRRGIAAVAFALAGCGGSGDDDRADAYWLTGGGDAERGRVLIDRYGCDACHTIPGVRGAHGLVGPPLAGIARRVYIAGVAENTPLNLMKWITDPQSVDNATAMPKLGVTGQDARHIAAYLYTLR